MKRVRVHYVYEYLVDPSTYPDSCETAVDCAELDLQFSPEIVFEDGRIEHAEWTA